MSRTPPQMCLASCARVAIVLILLVSFFVTPQPLKAASIIYVNDDAAGLNDGTSWANAYTKLRTAIAAAQVGDEIWVAKGVYYPDEGGSATSDSTSESFTLRNGIALYGGFAGDESQRSQRNFDPGLNISVLSGDITQNDDIDDNHVSPNFTNISTPNTIKVVIASGVNATAILDGFTITGGRALEDPNFCEMGGCGGGLYSFSGSATLANLTFISNLAYYGGGMMLLGTSTPTLTDMRFISNKAETSGAGLRAQDSAVPTITRALFQDNDSTTTGGGAFFSTINPILKNVDFISNLAENGGGLYNINGSPTLENVNFTENRVQFNSDVDSGGYTGGGVYNEGGSPILRDVTFTANESAHNGGGLYNNGGSLILGDVTFTNNNSSNYGGALHSEGGSLKLEDVAFTQNNSNWLGGAFYSTGENLQLKNVEFTKNSTNTGAGIYMEEANATLLNVIFTGNTGYSGGGLYNANSNIDLINATFTGNSAHYNGGGISTRASVVTMTNISLLGNHAIDHGGGIDQSTGTINIVNGLFSGNYSKDGYGGMEMASGTLNVTNTTFSDNSGGLRTSSPTEDAYLTLNNVLIWGNARDSKQNFIMEYVELTTHHSLIEGFDPGGDNLDGTEVDNDPRFVRAVDCATDGCGNNPETMADESANDNYGDMHLRAGSPAIDAGDNSLLPRDINDLDSDQDVVEPIPFDLLNKPRVAAFKSTTAVVDIGAYEAANTPPVANAGGPYTVNEGANLALNGAASTDNAGVVNYAWDCTNDGSADTNSASPTGSTCTYANDGTYTVKLTVKDIVNTTASATAQVTVNNVAPTYTSPPNQSAFAGKATSLLLGTFADPGAEAEWSITINWGDGSAPQGLTVTTTGKLPNISHTYATAGTFNVVVTVSDSDGENVGGFQVVVNPASVGSVGGIVFADANGNGTQDGDEPGVAGTKVTLQSVDQAQIATLDLTQTDTTDASGNYSFDNLPPDSYTLTLEAPSGYSILGNAEKSLTVQAGQTTTVPSFTLEAENPSEDGSILRLPAIQNP